MERIKNIKLRTDNSEIVPYTIESITIYAMREKQSSYPNMCGIMHWHDDIEFIRVVSGRINYLVNDNVIELNEGDIIFVNSQQIHGHRHINYEECVFDGILVPTNVLVYPKQLAEKYVNPFFYDSKFSSFVFRKGDRGHDELTNAFDTMMARLEKKVDAYEFDMVAGAYKLMSAIIKRLNCKGVERIGVSPWTDTLHKMIGYIQSNYKNAISLDEIAQMGNVSRSQCCKIFKGIMNKSPNDYLTEYRINKSVDLILETDMKMTEIAYECGFNGSSYFAEIFKKIMGVSPREYRKKKSNKEI